MIKIAHVREVNSLTLPQEVLTVVLDAVTILDTEYGENRNVDSGYGGYVMIVESEEDFEKMKEVRIDVETATPEYVDVIRCDSGQAFSSQLFLLGNDFGIVVILPIL